MNLKAVTNCIQATTRHSHTEWVKRWPIKHVLFLSKYRYVGWLVDFNATIQVSIILPVLLKISSYIVKSHSNQLINRIFFLGKLRDT